MKKLIGLVVFLGLLIAGFAMLLAQPEAEVRGKMMPIPLANEMTAEQQLAQDLALADPQVQAYTEGRDSEVFGVRTVIAGQFTKAAAACATADCRQVEIYNWDENVAFSVLVNVETQAVLDVLRQPGMHPGINQRLHALSLDIAANAPEVIEALGYKPSGDLALAAVNADMLGTTCAGEHLCVGVTFPSGADQILWAMVDLTEEELAGISYTNTVNSEAFVPHVPDGCPAAGSVNRDGWTMDYQTTNWDSMNVFDITYDGNEVATSIKLVEWHADYGGTGFRDSTGCSGGGGGFTIFPYGDTQVLDLLDESLSVIGFEIVQDFRMSSWGNSCNYRYEQRLRFFDDGRFRVVSGAYGKGCGDNAIYRPVVRINMAVAGDADDNFWRYEGDSWQHLSTENYLVPYAETGHGPHETNSDGYSWRIEDAAGTGFKIIQDQGQFDGHNGRGASPFLYPTLHKAAEGDTDLGVIGACCNDNHVQGPDQYVNGENIENQNIVLWYVAQMETDVTPGEYYCWTISGEPNPETYPCFSGPEFIPTFGEVDTSFVDNGPVEMGTTAVFSSTTFGTQTITYTWNFGDGSTSTDENPTHDYAAAGEYTVVLTATNSLGSHVVEDTFTVTEANIAPTAIFSHTAAAMVGEEVSFENLSGGTPPLTYAWEFGDLSPDSSDFEPTHVYTATGTYTITLTVSSKLGSDMADSTIDIVDIPAVEYFVFLPISVNE